MSKLSLDKFLTLLERSKLVDDDRLAALVDDWRQHASPAQLADADDCARHLVDSGLLTQWQCHKLLDGRFRGFFLGQYKLLDHLGSGGMSTIYLAEHVLMQRRVAIKVLAHDHVADPEYLARFRVEAQAAAALDHRNIVQAYDVGVDGNVHFLVMEFIPGRDLHAIVTHDGPLDVHLAAHYVAQAAAGLEHAHHCGLVHRDIKPANLLVDDHGTVKILDMGLAQFTAGPAHNLPAEEHVVGTADYLAPEQAAGQQVDARADIYALGCTLYFLLTGHPPFTHGTVLTRMAAHQRQIAPSILLERRDAPRSLVSICRRMMEKRPDDRYPSATVVRQTLADWLAQETAAGRTRLAVGRDAKDSLGQRVLDESDLDSALSASGNSAPDPVDSALSETDTNLNRATVKLPANGAPVPQQSPPRNAPLTRETQRAALREHLSTSASARTRRAPPTHSTDDDAHAPRALRGGPWSHVLLAVLATLCALGAAWWTVAR